MKELELVSLMNFPVSRLARWLAFAGIMPQLWATLTVFANAELRWAALAIGYAYVAFIFSFLGGVWWGMALRQDKAPYWIYAIAVVPSLIAVATYLPWIWGYKWPGPSLIVLGLLIVVSPLVDMKIGGTPERWIQLRWMVSVGLGGLTIVMGLA